MITVFQGSPVTVYVPAGYDVATDTHGTLLVEAVSGGPGTGTTLAAAAHGTNTYGPWGSDGVVRLTASGRNGRYEVAPAQTNANFGKSGGAISSLVDGAGNKFPLSKGRLRVAFVGDSMIQLSANFGFAFSGISGTIPGICPSDAAYGSLDSPSGAGTLSFDGSTYATWAANGETAGAAVDVSKGGVFNVYSSGGSYLTITSRPRNFSGSPATAAGTRSTVYHRRNQGGFPYIFDAMMGGRCDVGLFGIGGDLSSDIATRTQQVLDWSPDLICDVYGTNDVGALVSPATAAATRAANWDKWGGIPVIATTIAARWGAGSSSSADASNRSDTKQQYLIRQNELCRQYAQARPSVTYVDTYSRSVDAASATGVAITNYTTDGLHCDGGMGWAVASALAEAAKRQFQSLALVTPMGANANYDATNNPSGNLITGGQGSFVGTGGTAGTGTTAAAAWAASAYAAGAVCLNTTLGIAYWTPNGGTSSGAAPTHRAGTVADAGGVQWTFITDQASVGWATTWNISRVTGSAAIAFLFKSADPDGGAPWQEIFCTNLGTAEAHAFRAFPATLVIGNIATGDLLEGFIEADVQGFNCNGLRHEVSITGGVTAGTNVGAAYQLNNVLQGITGRLGIRSEPFQVQASTTAIQPRITINGNSAASGQGAVYRLRVRNYAWKKVA